MPEPRSVTDERRRANPDKAIEFPTVSPRCKATYESVRAIPKGNPTLINLNSYLLSGHRPKIDGLFRPSLSTCSTF